MPLFSVNMAVPVKENIRESQIYFLSGSGNVSPPNPGIDKKYLIFKTLQLILSLCFLMLFAYSMRATENEIVVMVKYVILGGVTVYPLLFILLAVNVGKRPVLSVVINASAVIVLFAIGGTTMSSSWIKAQDFLRTSDKEKYFETLIQLRSSCLIITTGLLYLIESLIMCIEIAKLHYNNN